MSREHRSAPTKLPAPKPYKELDGRHHVECVPTALGKPNHPCALTAARIAPLTRVPNKLPNPRCGLQLRSPVRGDTLPDESVIDRA